MSLKYEPSSEPLCIATNTHPIISSFQVLNHVWAPNDKFCTRRGLPMISCVPGGGSLLEVWYQEGDPEYRLCARKVVHDRCNRASWGTLESLLSTAEGTIPLDPEY